MLCLPLDTHHIGEYVKHPRELLDTSSKKECRNQNTGEIQSEVTLHSPFTRDHPSENGWKAAASGGALMEGLKEIVAAAFARHGIVCPADDPQLARPTGAQSIRAAEPTLTSALPEHNFRKSQQGDPAP